MTPAKGAEPGWTKGPWLIAPPAKSNGRAIWRTDGDGVNYARICSHVNHAQDANLIAAAPDLYEALNAALRQLDACGPNSAFGTILSGLRTQMACSLAKARGETS